MRGWLSSHRRRRRLAWLGGAALLGGVISAVALLWPNTGSHEKVSYDKGPVTFKPEPKQVQPSRADLIAAKATTARFILTAVAREHMDQAYDLSSPTLHEGMSRAEWRKGDIPVAPYPVDQLKEARERLAYSYKDRIGLDVLFMPKQITPATRGMVFTADLHAFGHGKNRHWLVSSWQPNGVSQPSQIGGGNVLATSTTSSPLSAVWLLVPLAVFGMVVLIPIALGVRGWYRGHRAARAYSRSLY